MPDRRLLRFQILFVAFMAFGAVVCQSAHGAESIPAVRTPSSFHFTVTSDIHLQTSIYSCVLDAIKANSGGPGEFQISVGDLSDSAGQTPEPLRSLIDSHFGRNAIWYPVVGNHDITKARGAKYATSMEWLRTEYETGHGLRKPLKDLIARPGPAGSGETTYSWDHGNAHFVVLNEYWNGRTVPGSDTATDGRIVPALRRWLEADLAVNTRPFVFIFGHEPAYSQRRHVGNSLDKYAADRDAFWDVLKKYNVQAFISGHIHYYYKDLREGVYQISDGNAGNGKQEKHQTYLDVIVGSNQARIHVWQNKSNGSTTWHLADTILLKAAVRSERMQGRADRLTSTGVIASVTAKSGEFD